MGERPCAGELVSKLTQVQRLQTHQAPMFTNAGHALLPRGSSGKLGTCEGDGTQCNTRQQWAISTHQEENKAGAGEVGGGRVGGAREGINSH